MIINIIQFIGEIIFPYFVEEYAYKKLISSNAGYSGNVTQTYGWRIIWDAAYFLVILSTGYQIIFLDRSFSFWQLIGYIIFLCGIGLRILSLKELGKFYDPGILIKTDHQIVKTGPYRIFRHPLHLGTLMKISGLASFSPLWMAVPIIVVSLVLGLNLNRTEDRTHAEQLGLSFQQYYHSTWDIVDLFIRKNRIN